MYLQEKFDKATRILDSNYYLTAEGEVLSNFNKTGRAARPIRLLTPHLRNGYPSVRINIGTGIKHHTIHKLMAITFLPNPNNYDQVNHINGIKTDNRLINLEWSNASLNMKHAYENGLMVAPGNRKGMTGDLSGTAKAVLEYDTNGLLIRRHQSLKETASYGFNPVSVSRNCNSKTLFYKNRKFVFESLTN